MKFCPTCGKELIDEAEFCPGCGCAVPTKRAPGQQAQAQSGNDTLAIIAKIFLILGCISGGWMIIPLAWMLPITLSIFGKLKRGEQIGTGLKVCALLFVNLIAGIVLLCRSDA